MRTSRWPRPKALANSASSSTVSIQPRGPRIGGVGYLSESGAGRLLRDAKLDTIGAGTNEIRRMLIGGELIGRLD